MIIGYAITFALAIGLLFAYLTVVKEKEFWLTMLYVSVSVVNLGYLLISVSKTVEFAIFANDVSYLGSVFLSACMFLTIVRLCGFDITRGHVITCISLAVIMFSIVATAGFLPLYYKSVKIVITDGATKLDKDYGILHNTNLVYLLGYIVAMIVTIIHSYNKKKLASRKFAALLTGIVCMNVAIWGFEKFADWNFEFLSVTYILSELMLLFVYWMMQDYVHKNDIPAPTVTEKQTIVVVDSASKAEKLTTLLSRLPKDKSLTAKETEILGELVDGRSRKDISAALHISENTVKTHVTHIYEKFGVSSRASLLSLLHKD